MKSGDVRLVEPMILCGFLHEPHWLGRGGVHYLENYDEELNEVDHRSHPQ